MTPRQNAYKKAQQRGMTITENREGNGITVRLEAPKGCDFGSEHEIVYYWYSGSDWQSVIDDAQNLPTYQCEPDCEWWQEL